MLLADNDVNDVADVVNVNDVNDINNVDNTNNTKTNDDRSRKKNDHVLTLISIESSDS
jgi:hypothetical protein